MKKILQNNNFFYHHLTILPLCITVLSFCTCTSLSVDSFQKTSILAQKKIAAIEASTDGHIGLSALHTKTNKCLQYRADERFPLCSTFKVLVAAAILKKSMSDDTLLQQHMTYNEKDIEKATYSPITKKNLNKGMNIAKCCEAAIQYSDNTAANLLMKKLGGPPALTQFLRSIHDHVTRIDRWEPELNSAIPSDLQDTSSPAAMEKTLYQLTLGDTLGLSQREQLQAWLKGNTTGNARIRAGVPKDWIVGDKTGSGSYGTTNDVGIIWPPNSSPIIVAIYFKQNQKDAIRRDDVIASVTRILVDAFTQ